MPIVTEHRPEGPVGAISEVLHERSSVLIGLGAFIAALGVWALLSNFAATVASVYLFGALMLGAGLTQLVLCFFSRKWTGAASHLIIGVLAVVTGLFLVRAPLMGAGALTLLFASWLLASGIGELAHAVSYKYENWGWSFGSGLISAFLGLMLLARWPSGSLWVIGLFAGIALLIHGINWITLGVGVRRAGTSLERRTPPL